MKRMILCVALIAWSSLCSAAVYKWVDSQGKTQYGDRPPDGVQAELVSLNSTRPGAGNNPARSSSSAAQNNAAQKAPSSQTPPSEDAKKVQQDVEASRAKQCTEAQERYKKAIESRRLYKTGPNGERIYLSNEEIDAERLNAKRDLDGICNSPT